MLTGERFLPKEKQFSQGTFKHPKVKKIGLRKSGRAPARHQITICVWQSRFSRRNPPVLLLPSRRVSCRTRPTKIFTAPKIGNPRGGHDVPAQMVVMETWIFAKVFVVVKFVIAMLLSSRFIRTRWYTTFFCPR